MEFQYKNIKLNYEEIGEGKPIIILHGLGCDLDLMKHCLEPIFLTKSDTKYKRIYIDLPGMGNSGSQLEYASSDKILEVLIGFINKQIDENFLVMGESYGGYLARGILSRFPDKIDGMMLLCPVIIPDKDQRAIPVDNYKFMDQTFLKQLHESDRHSFCTYAVVANEETYRRYCEDVLKGLHRSNNSFINILEKHYAFSFDVDGLLKDKKFAKPVLFLCGRQDDCVGFEDAWKLIPDYPRATFSLIDVAGHNLQIEQPEVFHSLVANWLLRIAKFS